MGVNLVIINGDTKIDLTTDTVSAGTLKKGETAHNAAGDIITGTLEEALDTSDATATAADIASGKTAYVSGEKITGTANIDDGYFEESILFAIANQSAFNGNTYLRLSKLPRYTVMIGEYCFYGCTGITISEIPASVTTINNSAFTGCTGITSLTFKGTPTSIAGWTFGNNPNLTDIYVPWSEGAVANAPWGAAYATIHYDCEV